MSAILIWEDFKMIDDENRNDQFVPPPLPTSEDSFVPPPLPNSNSETADFPPSPVIATEKDSAAVSPSTINNDSALPLDVHSSPANIPQNTKRIPSKTVLIVLAPIIAVLIVIAILMPTVFIPMLKNEGKEPNNVETFEIGNTITFGEYQWRVLDVQDGKALIITDTVIEKRAFTTETAGSSWGESALRNYLNDSFYNQFNAEEKARIIETTIMTAGIKSAFIDAPGDETTVDKIFLLSVDEAERYFKNDKDRATDSSWWLRSYAYYDSHASVDIDGEIDSSGGMHMDNTGTLTDSNLVANGVRPAMWVSVQPGSSQLTSSFNTSHNEITASHDKEQNPTFQSETPVQSQNPASTSSKESVTSKQSSSPGKLQSNEPNSESKNESSSAPVYSSTPEKPKPITVGQTIQFGNYDWKVLDVQNDKALIITEYVIEYRPYHNELKDITWENCTLRSYLNGTFYNKFSSNDKNRILDTRNSNPDNAKYGTSGGNDTVDKIFLLSIDEANKYSISIPQYVLTDIVYWLRSPGDVSDGAAGIYSAGIVNYEGYFVNGNGGVRPACWITLD